MVIRCVAVRRRDARHFFVEEVPSTKDHPAVVFDVEIDESKMFGERPLSVGLAGFAKQIQDRLYYTAGSAPSIDLGLALKDLMATASTMSADEIRLLTARVEALKKTYRDLDDVVKNGENKA